MKLSLEQLNQVPQEVFVAHLASVWEYSPWIVEAAARHRPFVDADALHAAMFAEIERLPQADLLAFLNLHPELAGAAARDGAMTADSVAEQGALAIAAAPADQVDLWDRMNAQYRARFGFPFILCAREHDSASALLRFEARMPNGLRAELAEALAEIRKISRLRLIDRLR